MRASSKIIKYLLKIKRMGHPFREALHSFKLSATSSKIKFLPSFRNTRRTVLQGPICDEKDWLADSDFFSFTTAQTIITSVNRESHKARADCGDTTWWVPSSPLSSARIDPKKNVVHYIGLKRRKLRNVYGAHWVDMRGETRPEPPSVFSAC